MSQAAASAAGSLAPVISEYLAASDRGDAEAIVRCFAEDAVVVDEGREWRGTAPIRRWRATVATAYQYTVQVTGAEALGEVDGAERHDVHVHLEGNFPGGHDLQPGDPPIAKREAIGQVDLAAGATR